MNGTMADALREQRWDDHRYYHQSRINQSLHLISALSFLSAYVLLFVNPVAAVVMGWFVAMATRQVGHFFFEPKGFDKINQATHAHKEAIKVGYNLRRKVILISLWALAPVILWLSPNLLGTMEHPAGAYQWFENLCVLWLFVAAGAVLFRTVHLFFLQDVQTGVTWFVKILTDPFHDVKMYHRSPLYLLRGERFDPMLEVCGSESSTAGGSVRSA